MDGQKQKDLKARKKSPVLEPYDGYLNTLIDFLNFDAFDPIQRKHVAESHQLYRITFRDSPERLKEIREYVLSDVAAITELPRKNAKPDEKETYAIKLDIHLRKLFDRLVRLVSPKPDILSGQPKVRLDNSYIFDQATRKIRTGEPVAYLWDTVARNPASDFLTHEQKKFEWGEGKWIFKVDFSLTRSPQHFETDIPQVELYQLILKGLIDGELAKLRRCTICRTFFVRDDFPNQINCDEHKGMVDRSETKEAKRKSRNDTATVALRKMKQYITDNRNRIRGVADLPLERADNQFGRLRNLLGNRFDPLLIDDLMNRLRNESPEAVVKTLPAKVNAALSRSLPS